MISMELAEIIKQYFIRGPNALIDFLRKSEKKVSIEGLSQILYLYANDKNSSTLREFITLYLANYRPSLRKIGYNGVRGDIKCDAKPQNIDSSSKKRRHNGGGNFTDFTYDRLEKYKNQNINIVVSGFVNGRLIFILEFPFVYSPFYNRLKEQLDKKFHAHIPKGIFLRSANFTYKDYKDCAKLKIIHLNEVLLTKYRGLFTKGFYNFLSSLSGDADV